MTIDSNPSWTIGQAAAARIAALQNRLERYRRTHEEALAGLPPASEDPVAHVLAAPSRQMLGQVATALQKLADGTYGRCVSCQRAIGAKRLESQPYLLECVSCAVPSAAER
ncbi:TraR/DksA family transcriptional regulator [Microbacterium sp. F51-2R]|jgi:DnaK suppressor protein|uniref:TraR/DksA family transcriptional regulator n=1 Tax=Microbacterium sp. F51-2R TaxID=3445777 RepID=UPI003F9F7666